MIFTLNRAHFAAFLLPVLLAACNGAGTEGIDPNVLGVDETEGTPQNIPTDSTNNNPAPGNDSTRVGSTCQSTDPNRICLSLKYVAYTNSNGEPTVTEQEALTNLATINNIWSQCNIAFEIGEYVAADPRDFGLTYNTSNISELNSIRSDFVDDSTLLVVTTGVWSGSLGAGVANAWATMPEGGTYGVVLEDTVGTYGNIVAHELGHYLNLGHYADPSDVMNAVIYSTSTKLTTAQCNTARSAANYYWAGMQR